jgi:hypothetical protein
MDITSFFYGFILAIIVVFLAYLLAQILLKYNTLQTDTNHNIDYKKDVPYIDPVTFKREMHITPKLVQPSVDLHLYIDQHGNTSAPVTFDQKGYVVLQSGSIIPFYGKQSITRKHKWYYYVIMDGIKIPVVGEKKRNCMDELGCEELFDGDIISIDNRYEGTVKIYKQHSFYTLTR